MLFRSQTTVVMTTKVLDVHQSNTFRTSTSFETWEWLPSSSQIAIKIGRTTSNLHWKFKVLEVQKDDTLRVSSKFEALEFFSFQFLISPTPLFQGNLSFVCLQTFSKWVWIVIQLLVWWTSFLLLRFNFAWSIPMQKCPFLPESSHEGGNWERRK